MSKGATIGAALLYFAVLAPAGGCWPYGYSAEVGYYDGSDERWFIGQPKNRHDCDEEARGMFNRMNYDKPGRAFSWACLLTTDGKSFISRVR